MRHFFTLAFAVLLTTLGMAQERRTLTTEEFTKIEISGSYTVFLRQGPSCEVIAMSENFDDIEVEVEDGTLSIAHDNDMWEWSSDDDETRIYITVQNLSDIEISGAVTLESKNTIDATNLTVSTSGASEIYLSIDVSSLDLESAGASEITLRGKARSAEFELMGASEIEAFELIVNRMEIETMGASSARVHVLDTLEVEAMGASDIEYKGDPQIESELSYASSLTKR
ncbi:head GIN domain-containing protein [Phaeocystidibacter luteus]|uniref:DUF2807 domain-containing protein n=1 Tax=Phaeocystidibacter luteus TaxID=911197 RepID=A0A6N6RM47_9FLAO|nr:head GIN domain-containing protein [Phaeocystidibacter luteus]KAB2814640.1 DUF2807 domain-containing protein [Phaeocystidibacter luteus]